MRHFSVGRLIKPLLFQKAVNRGGGEQWEIWGKEEGGGLQHRGENVRCSTPYGGKMSQQIGGLRDKAGIFASLHSTHSRGIAIVVRCGTVQRKKGLYWESGIYKQY